MSSRFWANLATGRFVGRKYIGRAACINEKPRRCQCGWHSDWANLHPIKSLLRTAAELVENLTIAGCYTNWTDRHWRDEANDLV